MKVLWGMALLLAGCMSSFRGADTVDVFDMGVQSGKPAVLPVKGSIEVKMPAWIDGNGIAYRLLYADPHRVHQYAQARWAGPVSALVHQRLGRSLGLAASGGACLVSLELDQFEQVFPAPQESRGVMRGVARLVGERRQVLATREVRVETPAATANAAGGVVALVEATDTLAQQLEEWLSKAAREAKADGCVR